MSFTFKQYLVESAVDDTNPKAHNVSSILRQGIRRMQRLMHLPSDAKKRKFAMKRIIDDFDLLEALDMVRHFFHETEDMVGKPLQRAEDAKGKKLRNQPTEFNFIKDVKAALKDYYFHFNEPIPRAQGLGYYGETLPGSHASTSKRAEDYMADAESKKLNKIKYKRLYDQVLEPIVDMFKDYSHQDALISIDHVIDNAKKYVINSDVLGSEDDARVARKQIEQDVKRRRNKRRVRRDAEAIAKLRRKSLKK